jgi:flavorubredoxin
MDRSYQVSPDVHVLPSHLRIPGVGVLLVNAFVLLAREPVLIDTGLAIDRAQFMAALGAIVDPSDLRWVWVTHDDADHTGNVEAVMNAAPRAKMLTHGLGALRMSTWWPRALERVHAIIPGDCIDVGDRTLTASRPPLFDNPTSLAVHDTKSATYFSVDAFGAILPSAVEDVDDLAQPDLVGAMTAWATFDSPWTHLSDRSRFAKVLDDVRGLAPSQVCSSHLPVRNARLDRLINVIGSVPDAEPFTPPNQAAFAEIVAQMRAG